MASTQTGTCLMVMVLCFVLVLGSLMPGLPELPSMSQTVKSSPLPPADIYTASQIRSRSLLFYDEGSALEDPYGGFLKVDGGDEWDGAPRSFVKEQPDARGEHEATKYLGKVHGALLDFNRTGVDFVHEKEEYHKRRSAPSGSTAYF